MSELLLDRPDLKPRYNMISCSRTMLRHFRPEVQRAIIANGGATFEEAKHSPNGNYNVIRVPQHPQNIIYVAETLLLTLGMYTKRKSALQRARRHRDNHGDYSSVHGFQHSKVVFNKQYFTKSTRP